jgi:hypothetical protein
VLTELDQSESWLTFGARIVGTFLVIDRESEQVIAEISKSEGTTRHLALPEGRYLVAARSQSGLRVQEVEVTRGQSVPVTSEKMREQPSVLAILKGGASRRSGWQLYAHYGLGSGMLNSYSVLHQVAIGLRIDLGPLSILPKGGFGRAVVNEAILRYQMEVYSLAGSLVWRFEYGVLDLFAGLHAGVSYGVQRLATDEFLGTVFSAGGTGGLDLPLIAGFALHVFWEVGMNSFRQHGKLDHHLALKGIVGLAYDL